MTIFNLNARKFNSLEEKYDSTGSHRYHCGFGS